MVIINSKKIYFAKVRPNAIIPSKRDEDAAYDIYSCFDEDKIVIRPNKIKLIPTGIASAFSSDYVLIAKERGSSGSKCMSVRMGVIDSGYRDEIFIGINNTGDKPIIIAKDVKKLREKMKKEEDALYGTDINLDYHYIFYPYNKAIAQLILLPIPKVQVEELPYKELKNIKSERGTGKLGSSGK